MSLTYEQTVHHFALKLFGKYLTKADPELAKTTKTAWALLTQQQRDGWIAVATEVFDEHTT